MGQLEKEVEQLAQQFLNKEITYSELYMALQKYPSEVRDKGLAMAILNSKENKFQQNTEVAL